MFMPFLRQNSIIALLPDLVAADSLPILQRSLSANAMSLFGLISGRNDVCLAGERQHTIALTSLRRLISIMERNKSKASIEMICTSATFVWNAAISKKGMLIALYHTLGILDMLATRDPEDFTEGLAFGAFRLIRFKAVGL